MKKYAVIVMRGDCFEDLFNSEAEALASAEYQWSRLTDREKKQLEIFSVMYGELNEEDCFDVSTADTIKDYLAPEPAIKKLRLSTGLNMTEFAGKFNIPYRTLQHWEAGDRSCPAYLLDLIEFRIQSEKEELAVKFSIREYSSNFELYIYVEDTRVLSKSFELDGIQEYTSDELADSAMSEIEQQLFPYQLPSESRTELLDALDRVYGSHLR